MIVTNHQIQNVLKVYTSQLSKGLIEGAQQMSIRKPIADTMEGSAESDRQTLIERLTKTIVRRIIRKDPRLENDRRIDAQMTDGVTNEKAIKLQEVTYNRIDGDATKTLNILTTVDPGDLIKRLEHHATKAVEKNLE